MLNIGLFGGKYLLVSLIRHIFEQFLKISSFLRNRPSRLVASCTNLFFLFLGLEALDKLEAIEALDGLEVLDSLEHLSVFL